MKTGATSRYNGHQLLCISHARCHDHHLSMQKFTCTMPCQGSCDYGNCCYIPYDLDEETSVQTGHMGVSVVVGQVVSDQDVSSCAVP